MATRTWSAAIAVVGENKELADQMQFLQNAVGAIAGPFDSFLAMRGLKTLALRMERHGENALEIARWLASEKKVAKVMYPGLEKHPQHELAKQQMRGFGGMVTIVLETDLAGTRRFLENTHLFSLAESLGGVESLINHPALMTHGSIPPETRQSLGITDSLVQIVGRRGRPRGSEGRSADGAGGDLMGNSFGELFRITTWGESHGGGVGVVIDGCPARVQIAEADIQRELDRRRPGQSSLVTERDEADRCQILSGVFEGQTLGTPISILVLNKDARPEAYAAMAQTFRPSHADFTYEAKYGIRNWQGGGRASARETIGRVAAGAVARKVLSKCFSDFEIVAYVARSS